MRPSLFVPPLSVLAVLAIAAALFLGRTAAAGIPLDADQIKVVLQTATPEDEGFVQRAVTAVNAGRLPRDIFDSCFLWARKKPTHKFQYFKRAIVLRAAEIGVRI